MPQLTERPQLYSSARIRARVVDDRTAEPISGAVVVVLWRKIDTYRKTFGGIYLHYEIVTNEDGSFEVPRWGPRTLHYDYYLDARDPEIWVLRRGYLLGYFDNTGALDPRVYKPVGMAGRARISKEPPARVLQSEPARYARIADAGSVWHDRTLTLRKASSVEEEAHSLALSAPLELYEPSRIELPLFWQEWTAARDTLPAGVREVLEEPPLPLARRRSRR